MNNDLPLTGGVAQKRFAASSVRYWNLYSLATGVATILVVVLIGVVLDRDWVYPLVWLVSGISALFVLFDALILNKRKYRFSSYEVTPDHVYVATGRLIRKTITVATGRILNVETAQGPILASMDLVLVRLVSAMEVDSLGPVTRDEADEIRRVVLDSQHSEDLAQDNAP